jgi:hypothetical protein
MPPEHGRELAAEDPRGGGEVTHERACIRGCTVKGEHFAACASYGIEDGDCKGCKPVMARDGALICERCYRRLRRHIEDAPDLVGHIRSIADPMKSGWNMDRVNVSSSRPDLPAPVAADLTDASYDVMKTLRDWAIHVDPALSTRRGLRAGADSADAFDDAETCAVAILAGYDHVVNTTEVEQLADAVLQRHSGEPEWWSIADALARYPLDDRPRYATRPCPSCDIKTVRVFPPRRNWQGFKYVCETCEWEATDRDDGGLWAEVFAAAEIVPVGSKDRPVHDPRWMTLTDAAAHVGRTVGTVRGWVTAGLLEPHLGRYWRDTVDEVARVKRGEAA